MPKDKCLCPGRNGNIRCKCPCSGCTDNRYDTFCERDIIRDFSCRRCPYTRGK